MPPRQPPQPDPPSPPFKVCPMCAFGWQDRPEFLADKTLYYNGYQADFEAEDRGLFYFTHETRGCGSTMTIEAKEFLSLYSGIRHANSRHGSEQCPRYCLEREELRCCPADCRHAFVREISQLLLNRNPRRPA